MRRKMASNLTVKKGFLGRLAQNEAGNVLFITAAAIFLLLAIAGVGVDASRAYLTHTRLQQACDAGILAGRKVMGSTGELSDPVKAAIRDYVRFNLPGSIKGQFSNDTSIAPTLSPNDEIDLTLSTRLNTVILHMFGKHNIDMSVNCSARNDYSNIDIALVLDTTGSMACKPERNSTDCSNWINGLRPYSGSKHGKTMTIGGKTVTYVQEEISGGGNISRMQVLRDALASFKTQMAVIETEFAKADSASRKRIRYAVVPFSQMVNVGNSIGTNGTTLYSRQPGWFNKTISYIGTCYSGRYSYECTQTDTVTDNWIKQSWDGCVEERATINTITPSNSYIMKGPYKNLPAGAHDLQIDEAPTNSATRWTIAKPSLMSNRQYACPRAMMEFQEINNSNFNNYFAFNNGFVANGGTYLDLGMLWAARFLSREGLWASENPSEHNGWPVQRYVIFMTDGTVDTGNSGYSAYGPENYFRRITTDGTANTNNSNHTARWLMSCSAVKNMDTKIFVI